MLRFRHHQPLPTPGVPMFFKIWFAVVALITISIFGLVIYTLFNPELIGEFFGRVVAGFKGAQ
jgi:hypothetical protein